MDFTSKADWESPVKLLELFPNANMCYKINKATKDANRKILAARLASAGRKRNERFPSTFCPHAFSSERNAHLSVCVWRFVSVRFWSKNEDRLFLVIVFLSSAW